MILQPPPDPTIRAVVNLWLTKIRQATKIKRQVFGDTADECMSFYTGPRSWMELMTNVIGAGKESNFPEPAFKVSVNKAFELVTLFGPSMYETNPQRTVTPRKAPELPVDIYPDPMVAQQVTQQEISLAGINKARSKLLEHYLNWSPTQFNLRQQSRDAIDEAIIKGRGCLWTEIYQPPLSDIWMAGSFFDSVDNLLVDPDAKCLEQATWIARKVCAPVWMVERQYGLPPGTIPASCCSNAASAEWDTLTSGDATGYQTRTGGELHSKSAYTNDLVTYFKVYSKMGIGGRLSGINKAFRGPLEIFGDFVYLAIVPNMPWPLNLPPIVQTAAGFEEGAGGEAYQEIMSRVAWPIPFWANSQWPVSCLDFHKVPGQAWPMSHLKPALPELKFLNWAMSFLVGRIHHTSRDFIAILKEAGEELKDAILNGSDLTILPIDANQKPIHELVAFLQQPPVNFDIWKIIEAVSNQFEKRTGLSELMYAATTTQIRSAEEAAIKQQNMSVRPADMAECVEAWMSEVAAKEAICARYFLRGADIQPIFGPSAAQAWDNVVSTVDINDITQQLEYRIEAGSTRKPNKQRAVQNMDQGVQVLLPLLDHYAQMTGNVNPLNNFLADWARSREIDPNRYQLPPPPPPPPPMPPGVPPGVGVPGPPPPPPPQPEANPVHR